MRSPKLGTVALLALAPLSVAATVPRDWSATLRGDARAFHDDIAANHPGPVNRLDPDFFRRNDQALALALSRAPKVHDFAGYRSAMADYTASFDDGHLAFWSDTVPPDAVYRWPGFLTTYDDQGAQVVATRDNTPAVPLGAQLLSCDGRSAERLAATNIGAFVGRWQLASQRRRYGNVLFADQGNPFVKPPIRCRFMISGKPRAVRLTWQPIEGGLLATRLNETARRAHPPMIARTLSDGTRWYGLGSFGGDAASESGRALPGLIAGMATERAALGRAPAVVLDLRGNNGGSSDWSQQIARILWGKGAVSAVDDGTTAVDWRASPANIAFMSGSPVEQRAVLSPEALAWFERSIAGMKDALAKHVSLWRDANHVDGRSDAPPQSAPPALKGPVYFITDTGCASACLDAADLWRALGAVQVGQETSGDTLYMDVRQDMLPSGQGQAVIPMKVYRGRRRGANVPLVPVHRYAGDMRDTVALEAWVARLPERRR